jgi:hypothetical protein
METLDQLLRRTIRLGAHLYNEGKHQACYEMYVQTVEIALLQPSLAESVNGLLLRDACKKAVAATASTNREAVGIKNYKEAAWILRRCFDSILRSNHTCRREH